MLCTDARAMGERRHTAWSVSGVWLCQDNSLYHRKIAVPARIIYTPSATTARLSISSSMPCYARMPRAMGERRHTAWSVSGVWLCKHNSLYHRKIAVPARIIYTPSATTARLSISSSMPCYPRMLRAMDDSSHTVWLCQERSLYDRHLAVPAQINYTPSGTTARIYISSSMPCYPRMPGP